MNTSRRICDEVFKERVTGSGVFIDEGHDAEWQAGVVNRTILAVCASRTGQNRRLCEALVEGTRAEGIDGVGITMLAAPDAGVADVLAADLVVLAASPNIGMINGALKDFFERIYYPCLPHTADLPCALVCKGDTDATGAIRDTEKILRGLRWRQVQPPMVVLGDVTEEHLASARELGATLAGGLSIDLW